MPEELTPKQAYEQLRELQENIKHCSIDAIGTLIAYQLFPLIEQSTALKEKKEKSLSFYKDLAHTVKYQNVLDEIHSILNRAHAAIDPKRIPSDVKINQWTTMQDFYVMLHDRSKWKRIEDACIGLFDPLWAPILKQYEEAVPSFFRLAEGYGVIQPDDLRILQAELQESTQHLRAFLVVPWFKHGLGDFFWLDDLMRSIHSSAELHPNRMEKARTWAMNVIRLLIRELERYLPQRGRKLGLVFDAPTRTFEYRKKSYQFDRETNPARLCAAFYQICPRSGKVRWEELAKKIERDYPSVGTLDREKIREIIRGLDRWLDHHSRSQLAAGGILALEGDYVVRLK